MQNFKEWTELNEQPTGPAQAIGGGISKAFPAAGRVIQKGGELLSRGFEHLKRMFGPMSDEEINQVVKAETALRQGGPAQFATSAFQADPTQKEFWISWNVGGKKITIPLNERQVKKLINQYLQ